MKHRMQGFTLVELSLVLLALGLILPAAIIFWQLSERHRVETVQVDVQQQSRDALVGFLHANYRLPCPALDSQGQESCTGGAQVGLLPWRTLGLPRPEAGGLRYGVYRQPSGAATANAPADRDLAAPRDRMNTLRVRTPNPKPDNHTEAPNPKAPPVPEVTTSLTSLLGKTYVDGPTGPLNPDCRASNVPPGAAGPPTQPCPLAGADGAGAVNLIDICLALNTASTPVVANAGFLATQVGVTRRPAAFVVAAPGMLDADGNGQAFDGANSTASNASPTFDPPSRAVTNLYDDIVIAASPSELFDELRCGASLSAISHAHFNVATGAFVLERSMYDYRDQLYIAIVLARADVAMAAAGVLSGAAGVVDAGRELASAIADTTLTAGARAFQIALASVGMGLAVASGVAAGVAAADAALSLIEAQQVFDDFAANTSDMTTLAISVNENALRADAIGH